MVILYQALHRSWATATAAPGVEVVSITVPHMLGSPCSLLGMRVDTTLPGDAGTGLWTVPWLFGGGSAPDTVSHLTSVSLVFLPTAS